MHRRSTTAGRGGARATSVSAVSDRERSVPTGPRARALGRELRLLHDRIRETLDDALAGIDPTAAVLDVTASPLARCRSICVALDVHHRHEDAVLFPWLLAAHPHLAAVLGRLEEDHRLVATLLEELTRAVDGQAPTSTLVRHLEGLAAIMENHFRYEERELGPVLDALDPALAGPPLETAGGGDGREER